MKAINIIRTGNKSYFDNKVKKGLFLGLFLASTAITHAATHDITTNTNASSLNPASGDIINVYATLQISTSLINWSDRTNLIINVYSGGSIDWAANPSQLHLGSGSWIILHGTGTLLTSGNGGCNAAKRIVIGSFNRVCDNGAFANINTAGGVSDTGPATPLPVELIAFTVKSEASDQVTLTWTTAQEINNSHFILKRSNDRENWTEIAIVEGNGNSYETNSYSFTDNFPETRNYYSLTQVDFDGTEHFLGYQSVWVKNAQAQTKPILFPNPVENVLNIRIPESAQQTSVSTQITDISGRILLEEIHRLNQEQTIRLETENLTTGIYFMRVVYNNEQTFTQKIIKQ